MDFENLSYEELDQHAMEQLVMGEDDLVPILKCHLFVEKVLDTLLSRKLANPDMFFRKSRSFELKLDLASAMELVNDKYYSGFRAINRVRNKYAHNHDYQVTLDELNGFKFDWEDNQNKAYALACENGIGDAIGVATIFLCWQAINLIKSPAE